MIAILTSKLTLSLQRFLSVPQPKAPAAASDDLNTRLDIVHPMLTMCSF